LPFGSKKISLGRVKKYPGQRWVGLLFTAGQKHARVGSIFCGSGQTFMVCVWILKISSKNVKFFNFLPFGSKKISLVRSKSTRVKGGSASYLLRVKSTLGSGLCPSLVWGWIKKQSQTLTTILYRCLVKYYNRRKDFLAVKVQTYQRFKKVILNFKSRHF